VIHTWGILIENWDPTRWWRKSVGQTRSWKITGQAVPDIVAAGMRIDAAVLESSRLVAVVVAEAAAVVEPLAWADMAHGPVDGVPPGHAAGNMDGCSVRLGPAPAGSPLGIQKRQQSSPGAEENDTAGAPFDIHKDWVGVQNMGGSTLPKRLSSC
jgi:hypothetical protein